MIPVKLELKNFMSYGMEVMPLDFRGMHVACLSGDNGHGKSALLDAITWALWGEARASGDELIRLGAEEMRVTFDFQLEDDLYRVIRGRSKRNSGNVWEVYVAEKGTEWRAITGQGIRETGQVIRRILRMDYKTFINSAYIQQGRADEFTRQSVSDRKRILADILDLSRYDALEEKAKERRKEAESEIDDLSRDLTRIDEELAQEEGFRTQLEESRAELEKVSKEIVQSEIRLRELEARRSGLEASEQKVLDMERQISCWQSEIESLMSQKLQREERVNKSREILKDRERILSGVEKLRAARDKAVLFDRKLHDLRSLENDKSRLEHAVEIEKHKLLLRLDSLKKEASEVRGKIEGAEAVRKDADRLRKNIEELDSLEVKRSDLQKNITEQSDKLGLLKAQHDQLQENIKPELEKKLSLISQPGAKCPLCKTDLDEHRHEEIIAGYRKDIADADGRIKEMKKDGIEAKKSREKAEKELAGIETRLKAGMEIRSRFAKAEHMLSSAAEYIKQLSETESRLSEIQKEMDSQEYAPETRKELREITRRITNLGYDAAKHQAVKQELTALEPLDAQEVLLRHAKETLPADEAGLKSVAELISSRQKSIVENQKSVKHLSKFLDKLPSVKSEHASVSAGLSALRETDRLLTGKTATLEHTISRLESLKNEAVEKSKSLDSAKKDRSAYTELTTAFGKRGVQALIIENAIPEIQDEANRLLARMTDNAMQVSIETLKDKKTGGISETLDIRISDDIGTRSYDLYSGGEAFRINFALRIALSRLLARRAGARLQTLIIDEGFGTQDAKGREKLVEAIDSIKDDFEKILVITHINELKDAFPTHIEVTKDETGSHIEVE